MAASSIGNEPFDPTYVVQRTSVLAIVSFVLGLVCFVPGLGAIAVLLGIAAIVLISTSRGRLTGTGWAAAGVVLGLLFTVIQIALVVGAVQGMGAIKSHVVVPTNEAITAFDTAGDPAALRKVFTPEASATITDAQITAFRDAYRAELGAFKSVPTGWREVIQGYQQFGHQMQKYQAQPGQQPDQIPLPARFDKGWALLVIRMDSNTTQTTPGSFPVKDVAIETPGGSTIRLSEMPGGNAAPAPAPAAAPAAGDAKPADAPPVDGTPGDQTPADPKSGG